MRRTKGEGSFVGDGSDELDEIDWNWLDLEVMKEDTGRKTAFRSKKRSRLVDP